MAKQLLIEQAQERVPRGLGEHELDPGEHIGPVRVIHFDARDARAAESIDGGSVEASRVRALVDEDNGRVARQSPAIGLSSELTCPGERPPACWGDGGAHVCPPCCSGA